VILAALKYKVTTALWTVDPRDYSSKKSSEVIEKLKETQFGGGEIVLFHTHSYATTKALPDIIQDLYAQGIQITNVSEAI